MHVFKTFILVVVFLIALPVKAESEKVLKVITDNWTDYTNKDGSGYYFDLLRAVYGAHDIKLKVQFEPYARAEFILKRGDADVFIGAYKGLFEESWYSKYPVDNDVVDAAITHSLNEKWQGVSSLKNKKVVSYIGYSYDSYIDLGSGYFEIGNFDSMIKMLAAGRVDAILNHKADTLHRAEQLSLLDKFVIKESIFTVYNYFAFHNPENNNKYQKMFDEGFRELVVSGELKEIMVKNLGGLQYYPDYSTLTLSH